jgi:hypothetical protein
MIWNDNSQRGNKVTWSGPCENGKAEGQGVAVRRYFENGTWKESRFEGELEGGKSHGKGTWIGPDGEQYEGEWKDGLPRYHEFDSTSDIDRHSPATGGLPG